MRESKGDLKVSGTIRNLIFFSIVRVGEVCGHD